MKLLIKKVLIADKNSLFAGLVKDILVVDATIAMIDDAIVTEADETIEAQDLAISPGWVDIFADFADPGYEHRESLESGAAAALAGGISHVFVLPNTKPSLQNKPQVAYIVEKQKQLPVHLYPIGAISKNIEGKDLAEMYEMQQCGAIAFSDGLQPVQSSGLLLKALQYINAFNGTIIQLPIDKSIGAFGLMTEGIISTQMGLPGIPALAETMLVKRDIDLLRYTNSKLHITGISTAESAALVAEAKAEGLAISSSVTPYHLFFCDEDLEGYDTNLKLNPPLRKRADMMALRSAVENGTIDCITSHHLPQNWDNKTCEFEYAAHGMIGLQTSFAVVNHLFGHLPEDKLAKLMGQNARQLFNLPDATIEISAMADFTVFSKTGTTILNKENNKSKSANSPFIGIPLTGSISGVFTKGKWNGNK
ncbi:dihydroorotase [Parasediminibacterium sp. JCM 36343]|uniref:dihydroorotase n=1 Tax=Parasediminibacterium sp. JCM 36343 TaxID=3374279 RepID=UPI00397C75BF